MQDTKITLSICIPIYNFGAFIAETLESIFSQMASTECLIEVLIVDGGSNDNTDEVIKVYSEKYSLIRYVKLLKRGGIDADLAKAVELANGEYCWLLSGDDLIVPGQLSNVLIELQSGCDVYIHRHTECDKSMNFKSEYPVFTNTTMRQIDFNNKTSLAAYLSQAITTEAIFSFMSTLVINRKIWASTPYNVSFLGTCWGHVAHLFGISMSGLSVRYTGLLVVNKRGDNDSFLEHGVVNRIRIAVDGYHNIANHFYDDAPLIKKHIRRLVRNDLPIAIWLLAKWRVWDDPKREDSAELKRLIKLCCSDICLKSIATLVLFYTVPSRTIPFLRALKRMWFQYRSKIRV
jgi:abequosyltransferase